MSDLVDRLTVRVHEAERRMIFEFSGNISCSLRKLRQEINALRAEAGLGPSPVEMSYPDEESIDLD